MEYFAGLDVSLRSCAVCVVDGKGAIVYERDPSLSPDQREQVIGALWTIVTAFVELGFGVHPVQQACGKPQTALDRLANSESTKHKQDRKNPETDAPAI